KVGTAPDGGVDVDDLRAKADGETACLMLTNPNTLGLFDRNIEEIARIVHEAGATLYYDGANLNAVVGISRPGDLGFDIRPFHLHKTFTQPHGGGGPGSGPIAVSDRIEPFLPVPRVVEAHSENGAEPTYDLDFRQSKSIGRLRGFHGNFGVFVRAYAYICSVGGDGLRDVSETAVLNANYLRARLAEPGIGELIPVAFDRTCMHEFVLSGAPARRELGIKTLDIAKRLLDHRVHPPTVYFPLLVDEALMIEPTETETKETLDRFADSIRAILDEARRDAEIARNAPYDTPAILLAAGLDPERCTLFRQGDVEEHTELCWLLSSVTAHGDLNRMTQFKDKAARQRELVSVGLFLYPVLQAADVLAYRADEVPVGDDQRQHIELMRDIAERFNERFGETLVVPRHHIPDVGGRI